MADCSKSGTDVVLLNTGLSAHQLAQVIPQQSIDVLITEEFLPTLETGPASTRHIPAWYDGESSWTTLDSLIISSPKAALPHRPGGRIIALTSGTTGIPQRPPPAGRARTVPCGDGLLEHPAARR